MVRPAEAHHMFRLKISQQHSLHQSSCLPCNRPQDCPLGHPTTYWVHLLCWPPLKSNRQHYQMEKTSLSPLTLLPLSMLYHQHNRQSLRHPSLSFNSSMIYSPLYSGRSPPPAVLCAFQSRLPLVKTDSSFFCTFLMVDLLLRLFSFQ